MLEPGSTELSITTNSPQVREELLTGCCHVFETDRKQVHTVFIGVRNKHKSNWSLKPDGSQDSVPPTFSPTFSFRVRLARMDNVKTTTVRLL